MHAHLKEKVCSVHNVKSLVRGTLSQLEHVLIDNHE